MILTVGGIKGGSGKTTLATNLAVIRHRAGYRVLLIDADEQKSASDWMNQRLSAGMDNLLEGAITLVNLSGKFIHSQVNELRLNYDDIIIDTGGRDTTSQRSALVCSDMFLAPFKPRSLDIWTLGSLEALVHDTQAVNARLKVFALVNQADSRGSDNEDALDILNEITWLKCIPLTLGNRKDFANAASSGKGVIEISHDNNKANQEIRNIHDWIYKANL